jgi:two-component system phosphate regulon response regulator PhoB
MAQFCRQAKETKLAMREKIIVVEDDQDIQYLLKSSLLKAGYDVDVLSDGNSLIHSTPAADLFLFDVNLPGVSGLELCRHFKMNAETKKIPVILVSAYPDLRSVAFRYLADDTVEKPFNFNYLITLIAKHIHKTDD